MTVDIESDIEGADTTATEDSRAGETPAEKTATVIPLRPSTVERGPVERGRLEQEPLWRELAGDVLRDERARQGRTLSDVADRAGISPQYLSEVERGRKEPSSEMLSSICGALGLRLADLLTGSRHRLILSGVGISAPVVGMPGVTGPTNGGPTMVARLSVA